MDKDKQPPSDAPESSLPRPEPDATPAHPEVSKDKAGHPNSLEDQLAQAKEEVEKLRNNWHRAEADFQNYKKRTEQEREELRRSAQESLIFNLLPILDDFERAFRSIDIHLAGLTWFEGIILIHRKLLQLLSNLGVAEIQTEGQAFDPRFHEAVAHADGEEGKVLSEVQRGYKLHDRVLRPAMVVVGKGKGEAEKPATENKEQPTNEGE